ncbi:D-alanyl-D-alanine carboxypeptidase family protein [Nonomuraea typhae]|uniref:D-alanyl-D-alanine carboxypeptidase family protein n=1 Tax=Nonomuraea typhae TaxID=2603600 RepID=A0ABW7YPV2_9ACTN
MVFILLATGCAATSSAASLPSLPWPDQGQAAMEADGAGSLGSSGGSSPVPIASVTKVMTAYVILQEHPLQPGEDGPLIQVDQTAEDEAHSVQESTVPIRAGQRVRLRRMLELMLVPSGNNAARLLARWDAGSEQRFTAKMNAAARRLGMAATRYTGASGNEDSTVSTAADQLLLAKAAMRQAVFREVVAERETGVPGDARRLPNTNTLLGRYGVVGIKTGSGTAAGGNLMWAARLRGRLVYGVVLGQAAGTNPVAAKHAALLAGERLSAAAERWSRLPGAAPGR